MVRWVAHSPTRPGHKPKRTKTGQVRPQPGQASANYDRLRGEGMGRGRGRGGGARDLMVVNHTQVLERRSAVQDRSVCLLWTGRQDGDFSGFFQTSARCVTA
jgi:hypothetical protein